MYLRDQRNKPLGIRNVSAPPYFIRLLKQINYKWLIIKIYFRRTLLLKSISNLKAAPLRYWWPLVFSCVRGDWVERLVGGTPRGFLVFSLLRYTMAPPGRVLNGSPIVLILIVWKPFKSNLTLRIFFCWCIIILWRSSECKKQFLVMIPGCWASSSSSSTFWALLMTMLNEQWDGGWSAVFTGLIFHVGGHGYGVLVSRAEEWKGKTWLWCRPRVTRTSWC